MNITTITPFSIWLFFYSAVLMGIFFGISRGYIPEQKAAQLAPIAVVRRK